MNKTKYSFIVFMYVILFALPERLFVFMTFKIVVTKREPSSSET